MSTTTIPVIRPTTSPSNPQGGGSGGGGMQRGASYFFGFLITFVVLLLVFVGCGVLSRRRFAVRRRNRFEWNMEPWAERMEGGDVGYIPPVLIEKGFARTEDGSLWKDLIPLGAIAIVRSKEHGGMLLDDQVLSNNPPPPTTHQGGGDSDPGTATAARALSTSPERSDSPTSIASLHSVLAREVARHQDPITLVQRDRGEEMLNRHEPTSQPHGFFHYLNPTSWFTPESHQRGARRLREPNGNDPERGAHTTRYVEKPGVGKNEESREILQIAVMIEMPSPQTSSLFPSSRHNDGLNCEIGVARVPFDDDLKSIVPHGHAH